MKSHSLICAAALTGALTLGQAALAQFGPPPPQGPPPAAQQAAPIDLTGYWVSVITEDWRWRMLTPPHGDYASVPLNPAGRKLADTWTAAQDGSCKAYGAAGVMRMPTRVHIRWLDPNALQLQTDWGEQTRVFHFATGAGPMGPGVAPPGAAPVPGAGGPPSLQGHSVARWELSPPVQRGFGPPDMGHHLPGGDLQVVTTDLAPGWLRRNGVPYGGRTLVTEYYQTFTDPLGRKWFDVTTNVMDPEYLFAPFITSSDFRSEPDGSKWAPHPCRSADQD